MMDTSNAISNLYEKIDQMVSSHFSFLTEKGYVSQKTYEIQFREMFIYENKNLKISIGYEPFDMWYVLESLHPAKQLEKISMPKNEAGKRLASQNRHILFKYIENHPADLNEHICDIEKFLICISEHLKNSQLKNF